MIDAAWSVEKYAGSFQGRVHAKRLVVEQGVCSRDTIRLNRTPVVDQARGLI